MCIGNFVSESPGTDEGTAQPDSTLIAPGAAEMTLIALQQSHDMHTYKTPPARALYLHDGTSEARQA